VTLVDIVEKYTTVTLHLLNRELHCILHLTDTYSGTALIQTALDQRVPMT